MPLAGVVPPGSEGLVKALNGTDLAAGIGGAAAGLPATLMRVHPQPRHRNAPAPATSEISLTG
jgi:hypothetical protein